MNRLKGLKLKFDVTDNPELSEAIQRRIFELGGQWCHKTALEKEDCISYLFLGKSFMGEEATIWQRDSDIEFQESPHMSVTLDYLYHLPKTHTVSFDGEDYIEISAESFAALKKSLIK